MYIYVTTMAVKEGAKEEMHRTQLYLSRKLHRALKQEASLEGLTLSEKVRFILSNYLHSNGREKTESGINTLLKMAEAE